MPKGSRIIEASQKNGAITLPSAPILNGKLTSKSLEGNIFVETRTLEGSSPQSLIDALITSYEGQGFGLNFRCAAQACGGFDFRYALETPGPREFRVNLDNFEYADLRMDDTIISLLVSELEGVIYFQQTQVILTKETKFEMETQALTSTQSSSTERVVLSSVTFDLGSAEIAGFESDELAALAKRLTENPQETLYLVGHSDQIGGLDANLNISRRRAASVRMKLITDFGVPAARIFAEGVAFLAPIADNSSEEGRNLNRRVEAVFLVND